VSKVKSIIMKFFGFILLGLAASRPTAPPRQTFAGISVVDTPIVRDAIDFARKWGDEMTFNHVFRSFILGSYIIQHDPQYNNTVDQEVQAIGALLHDVGWDVKKGLVSPDKRFEVDGAIAARGFIRNHTDGKRWEEWRVQKVWDSIALHAEHGIANYKEAEVQAVSLGIEADFTGDGVPVEVYKRVIAEYPLLDLYSGAKNKMIEICQVKPKSTYGMLYLKYFVNL
jgi:hypothetical protein